MARRWTTAEEQHYREELEELYVRQNKTIAEVAPILKIKQSTVYDRLLRLNIFPNPQNKLKFCNKRNDIVLPEYSEDLAEFIGIMLGDGCLTHYQTAVTLGTKESEYVRYVQKLMEKLFCVSATIMTSKDSGYNVVYIGSTKISIWLQAMGLVFNKVAAQVDVPTWVWNDKKYLGRFLRGFFDTDGSIYKLRFGMQVSLTNHSLPLLRSLRNMLITLEYKASEVSAGRVYLTRKSDVIRFFEEIQPANTKHLRRFEDLTRR